MGSERFRLRGKVGAGCGVFTDVLHGVGKFPYIPGLLTVFFHEWVLISSAVFFWVSCDDSLFAARALADGRKACSLHSGMRVMELGPHVSPTAAKRLLWSLLRPRALARGGAHRAGLLSTPPRGWVRSARRQGEAKQTHTQGPSFLTPPSVRQNYFPW